jgi:hypothetical protein
MRVSVLEEVLLNRQAGGQAWASHTKTSQFWSVPCALHVCHFHTPSWPAVDPEGSFSIRRVAIEEELL